jgi:hypothetical protein
MIQLRRHLKVYGFRIHKPLRNSAAYAIPFVLFFNFLYLNFHLKVYGIPWNFTVLYSTKFAELHEIKLIPYKIPYSKEFQKGTSEHTLVAPRAF